MRHPVLRRQLRRRFGGEEPDDPGWRAFLDDVEATYVEADRGHALLERSLELTSAELFERNQVLHEAMDSGDVAIWSLDGSGAHIELRGFPLPFVREAHGSVIVPLESLLAVVSESDRACLATALGGDAERIGVRAWINDERGRRRIELRGRRSTIAGTRYLGIAIDVTHHQEAEERRQRTELHQRALTRLARIMANAATDLDTAFSQITREIATTLDVARVGIWLHEPARDALIAAHVFDRGNTETGTVLPLAPYRDYQEALRGGRIIAADDAHLHPATRAFGPGYLTPHGIGAMLDAMIFVHEEVVGVICHEHVGGVRHWTPEEQSFAASVADLVALMVESQRRRAAEGALAEQQRLLRTVIDTAPNLIFAKDRAGRFTLVNRAVAEVYGTTVDGLIGKTDADFNANAAEVERFRADDLAVMDTLTERFIAEEPVTDASGTTRWVQTVKRPLTGPDGRADLVLGVATDITERKQAERERARLDDKLRQSEQLESLGLLAGGVAHDFNNLLTPIVGYADMGLEQVEGVHPELQEYFQEIRVSAMRARDLTSQLLAFGRKQPLTITAVDLNGEITQVCALLRRVLPEHITITADLDAELSPVRADRTQVHQILMNLAVNARDAMPTGGQLRFTTQRSADIAVLGVSDTGHGMDAVTQAQIFEPFFTTKAMGHGTGLGLATVYGVVQQHGGTIDVDSAPGAGTRFVIRLPTAPRTTSPSKPEPQPRTPRAGARRIPGSARATVLVVEDDPRVLRLTCSMLARRQFDILAAHSPERALELARDAGRPVDLLLTDVIMPAMNGRELHRRLTAEHGDVPVLYMTGYPEDVLGDGALDGKQPVLLKPFTAAALLETVDRVLRNLGRGTGPNPAINDGG